MAILQRMIQRIRPGKWDELNEIDKEYTVVEDRHGFPPKTRYRYISGGHTWNTNVVERLWDSFAAMEAAYEKFNADPEGQALNERVIEIVKSGQNEFLWKLE